MKVFLTRVVTIGVIYCVSSILLFRGRVIQKAALLQSDLLVLFLPFGIALLAYALAYWRGGFHQGNKLVRIVISLVFAVLAAILSFWLSSVIAFNIYGT